MRQSPIAPALELVEAEIAERTAGRFSVLLKGRRLRPTMLLFSNCPASSHTTTKPPPG